jgi:hypothetical protein
MGDVTVAIAPSELDAEQICAVLRTEGIASYAVGSSSGGVVPLQQVEIRVAEADAARARELVAAGRDSSS